MNIKSVIAVSILIMLPLCINAQSKKLEEKLIRAMEKYEKAHNAVEDLRKEENLGDIPSDSLSLEYGKAISYAETSLNVLKSSSRYERHTNAYSRSDFESVKTDLNDLHRKKSIVEAEISASKKLSKIQEKYDKQSNKKTQLCDCIVHSEE